MNRTDLLEAVKASVSNVADEFDDDSFAPEVIEGVKISQGDTLDETPNIPVTVGEDFVFKADVLGANETVYAKVNNALLRTVTSGHGYATNPDDPGAPPVQDPDNLYTSVRFGLSMDLSMHMTGVDGPITFNQVCQAWLGEAMNTSWATEGEFVSYCAANGVRLNGMAPFFTFFPGTSVGRVNEFMELIKTNPQWNVTHESVEGDRMDDRWRITNNGIPLKAFEVGSSGWEMSKFARMADLLVGDEDPVLAESMRKIAQEGAFMNLWDANFKNFQRIWGQLIVATKYSNAVRDGIITDPAKVELAKDHVDELTAHARGKRGKDRHGEPRDQSSFGWCWSGTRKRVDSENPLLETGLPNYVEQWVTTSARCSRLTGPDGVPFNFGVTKEERTQAPVQATDNGETRPVGEGLGEVLTRLGRTPDTTVSNPLDDDSEASTD